MSFLEVWWKKFRFWWRFGRGMGDRVGEKGMGLGFCCVKWRGKERGKKGCFYRWGQKISEFSCTVAGDQYPESRY